jgi:hypothetical protein
VHAGDHPLQADSSTHVSGTTLPFTGVNTALAAHSPVLLLLQTFTHLGTATLNVLADALAGTS